MCAKTSVGKMVRKNSKVRARPMSDNTSPKLFKNLPGTLAEQNALIDEMFAYVKERQEFEIMAFPLMKFYNPYHFMRLADANEYFAKVLESTRAQIALNIMNRMQADPENKLYYGLLPLYHKELKAYELEKRAAVEKKLNDRFGAVTVTMQPIPESPLVPLKEK